MLRVFVLAFVYALLTAVGCQVAPETRTKVVDVPDTAPMELPAGWAASYTSVIEEQGEDRIEAGPYEFECPLRVSTSGRAGDYCGFVIDVGADAFSFDVKTYQVNDWYYGPVTVAVSGAGDAEGAELYIDFKADSGYWYTVDYTITHVAEL